MQFRLSKYLFSSKFPGFFWVFVFLITGISVYATHNRAGEILYKKLPGTSNHYEFKIITYTEIGNNNADRPELQIHFGDGQSDSIKRTSKSPISGHSTFQRNEYVTQHTYSGAGNYTIWVEDPNRNGGVINVPNSINTVFYIESVLSITPGNDNNSPSLEFPPIDFACINSPFYHNPGATDVDGDSLVYSLEKCRSDSGYFIPGYSFPTATQSFSIDPYTGTLSWIVPDVAGEYNVAIRITEYRRITTTNGKKADIIVGSVLRDMQITVQPGCDNHPPEFEDLKDYCIVVGDTLEYTVIGTDKNDPSTQNSGNKVDMEVKGTPFQVENVATYEVYHNLPSMDPVYCDIEWVPGCNHVRNRPYEVFYKIWDNGFVPLSNFAKSRITVIAPPVPNFQAETKASAINLTWDSPRCLEAKGYRIYRKEGSSGFVPDSCETGVPESLGYEMIREIEDIDQLSFLDDNNGEGLIPGEIYCYLIISYFHDGAESIASKEVCAKLKKDVPILTNVSVRQTDQKNGSIYTAWSKPTEFDPSVFPGPYRYRIYRTTKRKFQDFVLIDSLNGIDDTMYVDTNLNTEEIEYAYKIECVDLSESDPRSMGYSVVGTMIQLSAEPSDNKLRLTWNEKVPWQNNKYVVVRMYRDVFNQNECEFHIHDLIRKKIDSSGKEIWIADSSIAKILDTTTNQYYVDSNLTNNKLYRYYIYSIGKYSLPSIASPLYNASQLFCGVPVDKEAPCSPTLTLTVEDCESIQSRLNDDPSLCSRNGPSNPNSIDRVMLSWTTDAKGCKKDDVVEYHLYYSKVAGGSFVPLDDGLTPDTRKFTHNLNNTRAGCYYITAVDSFMNESVPKDTVCIDNCVLYKLPNVFTPNGDNVNDYFEPFPFCYVESIELSVFNRWGTIVFETTDPFIKWDGIDQNTNQPVAEGVYFYTCTVHQITVEGTVPVELKGTVHVLGSGTFSNE